MAKRIRENGLFLPCFGNFKRVREFEMISVVGVDEFDSRLVFAPVQLIDEKVTTSFAVGENNY